jgi:protein-glucosylgalactosylhydroxylysine glucosidase
MPVLLLLIGLITAQVGAESLAWTTPAPAYLFSYFTGNGEDGLHFAESRDGRTWTAVAGGRSFLKPAVGSRLMRDPSIVRGPDGTFHLVWTTGWWDRGIGLAHSTNLIDWSEQQFLPVMEHEGDAQNCWAPEIFYDADDGRYLIFWSTTIPGRFPQTDPTDPGLSRGDRANHRIYYVETRDFRTFTKAKLLYDGGFNVIDAFIIKADRARYVMIVKDETVRPTPKKHLRVATAKRPEGPYGPASAAVSIDWVEGPSALKIGNEWIVYYDEYTRKRYGAIRSRNLDAWALVPDVSFPAGARHGTAFIAPEDVAARLRNSVDGMSEGDGRAAGIDRRALVTRHNPVIRSFDAESPLSVGNGQFAFTADVTGLQTFAEAYERTIPLGTLSEWGWHTAPNPEAWSIERFHFKEFSSHGRNVGYADIPDDKRTPEIQWLRSNPHRLHLGRLGFELLTRTGRRAVPADLTGIDQTLDLWTGTITSRFTFDGERVEVQTICHPTLDAVGVSVTSALMQQGRMRVGLAFPYGTGEIAAADWTRPDSHRTSVETATHSAAFARQLDADRYHAVLRWDSSASLARTASHTFALTPSTDQPTFSFVAVFSPSPLGRDLPDFVATRAAAHASWNRFWAEGGAIDLSGSRDVRWRELERRIVLSQYLTAIQCAGHTPPQESGLTFNSWEGKFHLEMHWWHAAQFALWNRLPMLERSLDFYQRILPRARRTAARQGYAGARWPKMTNPGGAESPSSVGPFLIWQQPHPLFYAELVYREKPTRETLERFREVVFETAEFMASYPAWDPAARRYVLGPPLQCAQEVFPKASTVNCTYELAYWRWGLEAAQAWRTRLGLARETRWDEVLKGLSPLPVAEAKYLFAESAPDTYRNPQWSRDHPAVTAAYGVLPGPGVDRETMQRTFDWIWKHWNWPDTWGWDYPMLAMTAARLGEQRLAVDALLLDTPKNVFRANGHNHQRPGLTIYLPGNGALLYAAAFMAAGWDGGPDRPAPGFPRDGSWVVRYERLRKAP